MIGDRDEVITSVVRAVDAITGQDPCKILVDVVNGGGSANEDYNHVLVIERLNGGKLQRTVFTRAEGPKDVVARVIAAKPESGIVSDAN